MTVLRRFVAARIPAFLRREDGAVIAEALIAVPFVTLFAVGILEFGNVFWERMQIESGLRDAGRYMARCRPTSPTYTATCSAATAKMIAFYGTQTPSAGAPLRVPDWGPDAADITISGPDADGTITLATSHLYVSSPLFGWLNIPDIRFGSYHEERYSGW